MSRAVATALSLLVLLAGAMPVAASDEAALDDAPLVGEIVPGEVVVGWRNPDRGAIVLRARGLALVTELGHRGQGAPAMVLSTRGRSVDAVIAELKADPAVAYAEPNYLVSLPESDVEGGVAGAVPGGAGAIAGVAVSDPQTGGQYSLDRMRVRDAWNRSTGGSNLVAVLDTGVQAGHTDLHGRVAKGYDFVNNDSGASDDNGHGTWVAGIIAANANDHYGIAGISWTDRILPVKIMDGNGTGSTADLAAGITYAANRGADVINMSVGGFPYSQAIQDAVNDAWSRGAVLVGAAGNNNRSETFYPASFDHVVSVSATQVEDEFSNWSSYGPKVDVSAPGSSVLTTNCTASACQHPDWGSHTYISGTSFATPNVSGVVALIRAQVPELHACAGRQPPARTRSMTAATRAVTTATGWVASTRTERSGRPSPSRLAGAGDGWSGTTRSPPPHRSRADRTTSASHLSGRRRGLVLRQGAARRPPRRSRDRRGRHAELSVEPKRHARRPDRRAVRQVRNADHARRSPVGDRRRAGPALRRRGNGRLRAGAELLRQRQPPHLRA